MMKGRRNPSNRHSTNVDGPDVPVIVLPTLRPRPNPIKPKIVHICTPSGARISTASLGRPPANAKFRSRALDDMDGDYDGNREGGDVSRFVSALQIKPTSSAYSRLAGLQASAIYNQYSTQSNQTQIRDKTRGLRHFSMKVCQKVKEKRVTTYNEVADEIVQEYCAEIAAAAAATASHASANYPGSRRSQPSLSADELFYDHKNIRRRVYDAINVLMAMQMITKDNKVIRWNGFPSNAAEECQKYQAHYDEIQAKIGEKTERLKNMILQALSLHELRARNAEKYANTDVVAGSSLPILCLAFPRDANVSCTRAEHSNQYSFFSDQRATIVTENELFQRLGLAAAFYTGTATQQQIAEAQEIVPPLFKEYVAQLGRTGTITPIYGDEDLDVTNAKAQTNSAEDLHDPSPSEQVSSAAAGSSTGADVKQQSSPNQQADADFLPPPNSSPRNTGPARTHMTRSRTSSAANKKTPRRSGRRGTKPKTEE